MFRHGESSPEMREVESHEQAALLLARIIETGPDLDPQALAALRQQLTQLGVLDEDGSLNLDLWIKTTARITTLKTTGIMPEGYPTLKAFSEACSQLEQETEYISPRGADIALEDYLYGLGMVMASEPAYTTIFENDPITKKDGKVTNGCHRSLTLQVLGQCGFLTTDWRWVTQETES